MTKTRFFTIMAAAALFCAIISHDASAAVSPVPQKQGIAAVVNDEVITLSDIRARITLAAGSSKTSEEQLEKRALAMLVDERLQMQEAKKLGITISDEQIDGGIASIARQNGMTTEKFKAMLADKKVSLPSLRAQVRAQIAWSYVVRRKLRPQINISESDIDAVFDQLQRKADKPEYHVAEIFLSVDNPSGEEFVKDKAHDLIDQLLKGAAFSAVARENSEAPGADKGGDLGWIASDQLPAALADAVSRIKPGQISQPVRGPNGYHILYLIDQREKPGAAIAASLPASPAKSVTALHIKRIAIPVAENDPSSVIAAKQARAGQLSREIDSCEAMEKKSADFTSPDTGDLGYVDPSKLPAGVAEILAALPDNKLSQPIAYKEGVSVLMICDRKEFPADAGSADASPPVANSEIAAMRGNQASREKIATDLGLERLDMMQQRYLQDLRASAFIEKRI